ncbi:hypothetical protein SCLARK_00809 [Spiroplasma clarkii]|uniref:Uncharacterized protein n=1 Tax=Spiroplasma clarkii TaxID=2139 RepID=A0A1Y0L135_9MOLU|nr:hypothetical protein [Spiroplasma clarkii]ARU91438.1 hypothetical protein SCLARK_00809 [Spiroplasma clarkii]ATX70855.1 hypothetical protein SCLAR_v1c05360 [Spiroplasma clarkii]
MEKNQALLQSLKFITPVIFAKPVSFIIINELISQVILRWDKSLPLLNNIKVDLWANNPYVFKKAQK